MKFTVLKLVDVVAHRVSRDRAAQDAEFEEPGWWTSILYITSSRRTGLDAGIYLQYERFPLQSISGIHHAATQAGLYRGGPLYLYLLYVLATAYF